MYHIQLGELVDAMDRDHAPQADVWSVQLAELQRWFAAEATFACVVLSGAELSAYTATERLLRYLWYFSISRDSEDVAAIRKQISELRHVVAQVLD